MESLSSKSNGNLRLEYNNTLVAGEVNDDVVTNLEPKLCKIHKCLLFTPDCAKAYQNKDVRLEQTNDDIEIKAKQISLKSTKVCLFCQNSHQSIKVPNIEVKYENEKWKPYYFIEKRKEKKIVLPKFEAKPEPKKIVKTAPPPPEEENISKKEKEVLQNLESFPRTVILKPSERSEVAS